MGMVSPAFSLDLAPRLLVERLAAAGTDERRRWRSRRAAAGRTVPPRTPPLRGPRRPPRPCGRSAPTESSPSRSLAPPRRPTAGRRRPGPPRSPPGRPPPRGTHRSGRRSSRHRLHVCSPLGHHADSPWAAGPDARRRGGPSSSWADRCGLMSNTTFFTVPVNANGFWSS